MKVILLAPLPPPAGGIAGWTERMLQMRLKDDWTVSVVDEKVIEGRTVFGAGSKRKLSVETKRCLKIWEKLWNQLKQSDVKIAQACIPAGATSMMREYVSGVITKLHGKKFIVHFRCTIPNMIVSENTRFLFRRIVRLSDAVFVLNQPSEKITKKMVSNAKIFLIPNFIQMDTVPLKTNFENEIKQIIYVGGVIPEKGCDYIIEIAKRIPKITFTLIGKIGITEESIPENVVLTGELPKEKVNTALSDADIFMFLSRFSGEGFSNALAEAMAYGLPCIVTDWAANVDMIEDKGGIVVRDDIVEQAIQAIARMQNSGMRKQMSEWNYNKVLNDYSAKVVTDQYVDAYTDLIHM